MKRIAALIDFSEVTPKVIDFSAGQARAHDAELYLLHVEPESGLKLYRKIDAGERKRKADTLRDEHRSLLARAAELREHMDIRVHPVLMEGAKVEETILAEVRKLEADHVVLGKHNHSGLYEYFFGSVGKDLIKDLDCPLTLISAD
jgi:nucleotide-binding universal stress UspA family protein